VRRLIATAGVLCLTWLTAACEDTSYRKIGAEITVLAKRSQDPRVDGARQRLVGFGAAAIPQIETALHTAQERGRLHLVAAMQDIGDAEAIPILRHLAVYDSSADVRASCASILKGWAAATATTTAFAARAERARLALARVEELRAKGEAPTPARR
jgi:HEAT repeat protein